MGFCPICKTSANLELRTGGDYERVDCKKCGKYQITGTALAMLESRMAGHDKKEVARLSHATRMMTATAATEWPEVNSTNLDDMLRQPLPNVDRQITNLLVWAAAQLEDDHLGAVELPDEGDLTGVIGTIDGRRVDQLVSRAASEGLIELVPDHCIGITATGWARLAPPPPTDVPEIAAPHAEPTEKGDRITKAHCNTCRGEKNTFVRAEHKVKGNDGPLYWSDSFLILQCCGCEGLSVRHTYWFSEWDEMGYDEAGRMVMIPGTKETYYPAPTVRAEPTWSAIISDEVLRSVMDELYVALNAGLNVLASIGARTLLDRAGHILIGDPRGGFEGKLSALQDGGYISAQEKMTLEAVADAGNASAHRGYTPTADRLGAIIDIIENFLHRAFVLANAAEDIRKSTPARTRTP